MITIESSSALMPRRTRRFQRERPISMAPAHSKVSPHFVNVEGHAARDTQTKIPFGGISRYASLVVIVIGLVALIGWLLVPVQMIRHLPALAQLSPTSAAIVISIAFSLRLYRFERINPWARWVSKAFRVAVGVMGLIGMSEAVFGWKFGWEQLLFRRGATIPCIQPLLHTSAVTVLCFYLLACSLILLSSRRGYRACHILTIAVVVIVFGALLQRLYGIRPLALHLEVEVVTSLILLVLAAGILDSNSRRGLMAVVSSPDEGGVMARRLLPASILIPVMLGWIRLWGERSRWFGPDAGLVLHVIFTIVVLAGFVWWNAAALNRSSGRLTLSEQVTLEAQGSYRRLLENCTDALFGLDLEGEFTSLNRAAEQLLGQPRAKARDLSIFETVGDESRQAIRSLLAYALLGGPCGQEPIVIRSATGEFVRLEAHITVLTRDGNPWEYMMLLRKPQDIDAEVGRRSSGVSVAAATK